MAYKQLMSPNLSTTDSPGWCLRFVGNAFGTAKRPFDRARKAWQGATKKHGAGEALPNAAVPVWFDWYGTIDGEYDNWGDVAIWVPGKGVFGTPPRGSGKSNRWDKTPQDRAKWLGGNAKYLGWSEDLNTYKLVEYVPDPPAAGQYKVGDRVWLRAEKWRVYKPGVKPVVGNEFTFLRPNDYKEGPNGQRGVIYTIKGTTPYANTYLIKTQMFGDAWIYLDKDATKV